MSSRKLPKIPRNTSDQAEKVFKLQLIINGAGFQLFCVIPCIFILISAYPYLKTNIRFIVVMLVLLLFVLLGYSAIMLTSILQVFIIRRFFPLLRMPDAQEIIMRYYTDPRMLYWGNMRSKYPLIAFWFAPPSIREKWLIKRCQMLTLWTLRVVYGSKPATLK